MTVLHSGTSKQYSDNWSQAFGPVKGSTAKGSTAKGKAKAPAASAAKKKAAKKGGKK